MLNLDEQVEIEFQRLVAQNENYRQALLDNPALEYLLAKPDPVLTREQIKARLESAAYGAMCFRIKGASYKSFQRRN